MRQQLITHWIDNDGRHYSSQWATLENPAPALGPYGALLDAVRQLSGAANVRVSLQMVQERSDATVPGPYQTVYDRGVIVLRPLSGSAMYLHVAAPRAEMFYPTGDGVNFEHPKVIALVSAAKAVLSNQAGQQLAITAQGYREQVKAP